MSEGRDVFKGLHLTVDTRGNYIRLTDGNIDAILSALAAAGYEVTQGWQPIETAPKDGTRILVSSRGVSYIAQWREDCQHGGHESGPGWQEFECEDEYYSLSVTPTLWRSLPAPASTPGVW